MWLLPQNATSPSGAKIMIGLLKPCSICVIKIMGRGREGMCFAVTCYSLGKCLWLLFQMGSFFLVNLCLVVITMQFQETKAREIELIENCKDETKLPSSRPLDTLIKFMKNLCNCKSQDAAPRVHHHHHHFYHHHHFHHHLYNCFVPASPGIFSNAANGSAFFSSPDMPQIKVEGEEEMSFSSHEMESEPHQDCLALPEQASRRNSKSSVCSHTLSIHAETSSAVSIEEIVTQAKTSVTLSIPSPTATAGFFGFASSNSASASRKNSCTGNAASCTTVSSEINLQPAGAKTQKEKDSESKVKGNEEHKPSIRRKDKELLKYRRFSQPAHVKLTRTPSPHISTYSPSDIFEDNINLGGLGEGERNLEQLEIDEVLPSAEISIKDLATDIRDDDCQSEVAIAASKRKKTPPSQRNVSTQSEDDMFDSLFNLRQSASYDVTVSQGAWQRVRALCRKVIVSKYFTFLIMSVILLNMICMGLEHYQQVGIIWSSILISHCTC